MKNIQQDTNHHLAREMCTTLLYISCITSQDTTLAQNLRSTLSGPLQRSQPLQRRPHHLKKEFDD